jgi:drug/metabolite transporter (DMT)-like permease
MIVIDQRNRDIFRQAANLFFSIAQFFVTFLPAFGIGIGIGDRATGDSSSIGPIYWAFFIWFLIFPACIAYGLYQASPKQRENEILRSIGLYTASAFIGVTTYALVAQFGGSDWILIAIFVWILASLLSAFFRLTDYDSRLTQRERYIVLAPISMLTGWVSLAILVNLADALKISGIIQAGTVETVFSVVLLLVALLIASFVIRKGKGNPWYAFPVIWGLIGVVIANVQERPNNVVAISSGVVALAILGVLLFSKAKGKESSNSDYEMEISS